MKSKYIWSEESKHDILQYFDDRFLDKVSNDLNQMTNAEEKLITIKNLLLAACDKCIRKQNRRPNNNKKRHKSKAFDTNCYNKRKELNRLGKLMLKFPNNTHIRSIYHNTKNNYKYMLKKNIKSIKEKELQKLRSNREKWKTTKNITSHTSETDSSQGMPMDEWIEYLKSLIYDKAIETEPHVLNKHITPFLKANNKR